MSDMFLEARNANEKKKRKTGYALCDTYLAVFVKAREYRRLFRRYASPASIQRR